MRRIADFACAIPIPRIAEVARRRMRCSSFVGKAERQWVRDIDGLSRGPAWTMRRTRPAASPTAMVVIAPGRCQKQWVTAVHTQPTGRRPPKSTPIARAKAAAPKSAPLPGSACELARFRKWRMTRVHAKPGRKQRTKPAGTLPSCPTGPPNSERKPRSPPLRHATLLGVTSSRYAAFWWMQRA